MQERLLINAKQKAEEAQQDLHQMHQQLAATHSDLTSTQHQLADAHTRLNRAKADVNDLEQPHRQLQQQVHALHAEAESAQRQHAQLQADIAAAQAELKDEQLQVNKLRQEGWEVEEALKTARGVMQSERLLATDRRATTAEHSAQSSTNSSEAAPQMLDAVSPDCHAEGVDPQPKTSVKVCQANVLSACMANTVSGS